VKSVAFVTSVHRDLSGRVPNASASSLVAQSDEHEFAQQMVRKLHARFVDLSQLLEP